MHRQRDAGFVGQSPRSKPRLYHRSEVDRDSYDSAMQHEVPLRSRRSVSPRGLSRHASVSQRIILTEQSDYDRHLSGSSSDHVESRSSLTWPTRDDRKRPHISEQLEVSQRNLSPRPHFEVRQRAELTELVDLNVNCDLHTGRTNDYENNLRDGKEKVYDDARFSQRGYDYEHNDPRNGKEKVYDDAIFPRSSYDYEHNDPRIGKEKIYDDSRFPQRAYDYEHNDPRIGKEVYDDSRFPQRSYDYENKDPRFGKEKVVDDSRFPERTYDHENKDPRFGKEKVVDDFRFPHRAYEYENKDPRIGKEKVFDDSRFSHWAYDYEHNDSRIGKEKVYDDSRVPQCDYDYEHNDPIIGKEKVRDDARFSLTGLHAQKSVVDDAAVRASYGLPPPASIGLSNYGEADGIIPSSSQSKDTMYYDHERLRCADPLVSDRLQVVESYKNEGKPMSHLRDRSQTMTSSRSKEFERSSLEKLRCDFVVSYQDGMRLPPHEFSGGRGKLTEPTGFGAYRERPITDSVRNMETRWRDPTYYPRGAYGPPKGEHQDYHYPESQTMVHDQQYPSDGFKKTVPPQMQIHYDHPGVVHDQRDISRCGIVHTVGGIDNTDRSLGDPRKCFSWEHATFENQADTDDLDMMRTAGTLKQGGDYLDSRCARVECGRRVSHEYEISHLGLSKDRQISDPRAYYDIDRDAGPKHQEGRFLSSPEFKYDLEVHAHDVRTKRIRDELGTSKQPDKLLKRKYIFEKDTGRHNSRTINSNKWYASRGLHETDEKWHNEDLNDLYMSRERVLDHSGCINNEITYDEVQLEDFVPHDWLSSQEAKVQKHNVSFHKHGNRYVKGRQRPGSLSWCNSPHLKRKSGLHKPQKVWKRYDDYNENVHCDDGTNNTDPSEDWGNCGEPDPSEDSEEFKQLVHEAFLKYTKMLNMNPTVRRRYKDKGESGSLFCIVCGRSVSKEFMDTQRLVTHAFMSHKRGRRAAHLGLHKAICVLLGWSTVVPSDTVTWVPEILPKAEAFAQKEDLIIWPPVTVIHNISMLDNNPKNWKVVNIEALETFLRGKGLFGGRIKVCLGNPSDQSIFVVKFLGTFTGLRDAEKIDECLSEFKHGRIDFERAASNNGKISVNGEAGNSGEKLEEHIFYGYMGIAEDLDKVDFNTRKSCLIKSKKDIQDLANAPVKPDER